MGYIDIHSHILPGMDDGSRSMRQTMRMLETAVNEGIAIMIATPHNMPTQRLGIIRILTRVCATRKPRPILPAM